MSHSARGVAAADGMATGVGDLVATSIGVADEGNSGGVDIRHLWKRKNRDEANVCNSIFTDVSL